MSRYCRRAAPLVLLLLAGCHTAPPAPPLPPPPTITIHQLLQATQFRAPLFYLEAPLYDPAVQEWIPKRFLDQVQNTIRSTIENPYTDTQLGSALARQLSAVEMQQVIDFYQSPAGQAVLTSEAGFRERFDNSDDPQVAANTADLLQATRLNDTLESIFMASADALIQRLEEYDCLAIMQIPGSHIGLNIARRNKVDFMKRQISRSLAQLYAPLSPADQAAYLAFARSATGQRYFQARATALAIVGKDFGQRLAEAIAPGLPSCVGSIRTSQ